MCRLDIQAMTASVANHCILNHLIGTGRSHSFRERIGDERAERFDKSQSHIIDLDRVVSQD